MNTVTIAIPSLHRPDLTARCIEFIQKQTLPPDDWEIIVIENEAKPDAILPDPLPRKTRRLELADNEGTTGSINRAVASSTSRYVLLLNNDVELERDYLARLIDVLDSNPNAAFATGKLLRATQRTHLDGAGDAALMPGAGYRLGHIDQDHGQFDSSTEILAGCGAAVLYRRDIFQAIGMLDADFFAYLDDLDLALRAHLLGHVGLYLPNAVAYHIGSATLGAALHPRVVEHITRNQIWLLVKDYPRGVLFRLLPRIVVYQCAWFLFVLRRRGLNAYLKGISGALRGLRIMRGKHATLMSKRTISNAQFIERLRSSERQIYNWQQDLARQDRSSLLNFYFGLFGKP